MDEVKVGIVEAQDTKVGKEEVDTVVGGRLFVPNLDVSVFKFTQRSSDEML